MSGVSDTHAGEVVPLPTGGFDEEQTLVGRIAELAIAVPDAPALVDGDRVTTYAALERRTNIVANVIRRWVGSVDTSPVAVAVGHDDEGLMAVLGAMKSGRPVVPLDPLVPTARLAKIYELSRAEAILTDDRHRLVVDSLGVAEEYVLQVGAAEGPTVSALPAGGPTDVACVFFTSGSTGVPKGVPWSHRMLACEAWSGVTAMNFGPADRMALVLPFSFSAGMGVVSWALSSGAALHLFDPRLRSMSEMLGWLTAQRITTMHSTPSPMRSLLGLMAPGQVLPDIRMVMTCAEPVHGTEVAALRKHLPPTASYVNWTGASEVGTIALNRIGPDDALPSGVIPTGRPFPHKAVRIRTENGEAAQVGEVGEVTVVSAYIANGYWYDEKRTEAKFGHSADGRGLYRMGDLGRLTDDGALELLGRVDLALKIRGYLVEPIEVESALLDITDVTDAVVLGEKRAAAATRLIAYVVSPPASKLSPTAIRKHLRTKLPEWMIPTVIVQLDNLPQTERGKVDYAALPAPPEGPQAGFVAPRTPWETAVAEIWGRALQLEEIGVHDDFSELGGDSLVAEEILTLTARDLNLRLPSAALLEAPTIAEFAAFVEHASITSRTETSGQASGDPDRQWAKYPTVVPLKTTGSKPPVFCFAGAGGLALTFLSMVRRLGDDQPAWGLQEYGLEQRGLPDWTVRGAARRHLPAIRAIQPHGPYVLVGYSFGGLVAYEAARRLRAVGEEVALLVTFDSALPGTIFKAPRHQGEQNAGLSEVVPLQRGSQRLAAAEAPGRWDRFHLIDRIRYSDRPVVKILRNSYRLPLTGLVRFAGTDHYDVFFCKGMIASQYYRIKSWPGRTLVFVAKDNAEEFDNRRLEQLLTGEWRIERVPGDHHSIWREPHVNEIAELLRQEIDTVLRNAADGHPATPALKGTP